MTGAEVKRPGRGVRLTRDERHAYQHALIVERKAAYDATPVRDHTRRRSTAKDAWWTLTGHLRAFHGPISGTAPFLGKTWDEVTAMHDAAHQREEGS